MHKNLPFNSLPYVQLQITLLYSQEYECNRAARERIGSHFDEISTSLAMLVHFCTTEFSIMMVHDGW
jgi:hypothetical protein